MLQLQRKHARNSISDQKLNSIHRVNEILKGPLRGVRINELRVIKYQIL